MLENPILRNLELFPFHHKRCYCVVARRSSRRVGILQLVVISQRQLTPVGKMIDGCGYRRLTQTLPSITCVIFICKKQQMALFVSLLETGMFLLDMS